MSLILQSCPNCETSMQRTGRKMLTYEWGNVTLYIREYECPQCGASWIYDHYRNIMNRGKIS